MALTLAQLYSNSIDVSPNLTRVAAACAVAAVAVVQELDTTPNHAARLSWAQKTLLDPLSMGKKMIWGVLADATVQAALPGVSDAIIQASVNGLVNSFLSA